MKLTLLGCTVVPMVFGCASIGMADSHPELVAFIGSPRAVELSPNDCMHYLEQPDDKEHDLVCMDRAFVLRYKIDQVVAGSITEPMIEFIGFYHYWGIPHYTQYEPAFVILKPTAGHLIASYIEPVEHSSSGWRVCTEVDEDSEDYACLSWQSVESIVQIHEAEQ